MLRKYSLLLIGLFISLFYFGQIEDPSEKVKWSFSYEQVNCEVTLIATINMNEHWHISAANLPLDCFSIPTSINIDKSPNYLVDDSLIVDNKVNAISLKSLKVFAGTGEPQKADMTLDVYGDIKQASEMGDGPVDAIFKCIKTL